MLTSRWTTLAQTEAGVYSFGVVALTSVTTSAAGALIGLSAATAQLKTVPTGVAARLFATTETLGAALILALIASLLAYAGQLLFWLSERDAESEDDEIGLRVADRLRRGRIFQVGAIVCGLVAITRVGAGGWRVQRCLRRPWLPQERTCQKSG